MRPTQTCTNLFGQQVTVFLNDHVGDKIASQGLYEKENLLLLLRLLDHIHHPVVLDIGANIGNHTLAFATKALQVHAFEPIPMINALLQQNVQQNHLTNVSVHKLALSDTDGEATIHMVSSGNFGASSFDKRTDNAETVTVQKRRGDALLAELDFPKVDLVKIDVEAHEVYVLRGLRETLQQHKPFITMEWNDPLTIERLSGSDELQFLFAHYRILVLGSNYDRGWWAGKPLGFLRRKFTRLFRPRTAVLYDFNPTKLYKNLLLIPKGKEAVLPLLSRQ
jgi:FkbM family methyltransferase